MPLDIVTAHTLLPGREDVAILLEEAMRSQGWTGSRMEQRRRALDERLKQSSRRKRIRESLAKIIEVPTPWWGDDESDLSSSESDSEADDESNEEIYVSDITGIGVFTKLISSADTPLGLHVDARLVSSGAT